MKKIVFLLLVIFSLPIYSQDDFQEITDQRSVAKNELSVNVLNTLVFGALEGGYERILSPSTSLGIEVFAKVFGKNEGEDVDLSEVFAKDFSVAAKFKYFVYEEGNANGFYANAFAMVSDGAKMEEVPDYGGTGTSEVALEYTDLALGVGIGGKFVSKDGFFFDVSFGLGRNFFHKDSPDIVILPNASIGYRF